MLRIYLDPRNWFLPAQEKKRKLIEATLSGETLERALADLMDNETHRKYNHILIDKKYGKISSYEFDIKDADDLASRSSVT